MHWLLKFFGILIAIIFISGSLFLLIFTRGSFFPHTDAIEPEEGRQPVAELTTVTLGGFEQHLLLRGHDDTKPVLLWLHGGPGTPQMPFAHAFGRELEEHFIVVHWDQRGAGKSNTADFDEASLTFEQQTADALELVHWLRERFGQDRIFLLGHSWGTRVGIALAAEHPELFYAWIGVSQVVDHGRATVMARDWLERRISLEERWTLGEIKIPAMQHDDYRRLAKIVERRGGGTDLPVSELIRIALRAPEYSMRDNLQLLTGMNRGGKPMHAQGIIKPYNLTEQIASLDIPAWFLNGRNDFNTPAALVREFYEQLEAPLKRYIIFPQAHTPFFASPELFVTTLIEMQAEVLAYHAEEGEP
ncbi:Pimeloyl-ACP methyl ester carboxylesterase [Cyclonatronum proteinivorum]|uniref:Proline iminopeptidase n=1 Tax=Cyclonatronum proteinivorum TaxID=1457365 RepID=A0A345UJB8_9BACT|nr:alpha/beta hydrolase [Cyclonatronum proteinivorum]AXJ00570.1 Pimeloyl-ACP methyl ester carboxylesterase [Cyclonatronum proteinivorum]